MTKYNRPKWQDPHTVVVGEGTVFDTRYVLSYENDYLASNEANDRVYGDAGSDWLGDNLLKPDAVASNDLYKGDSGADTLYSLSGEDVLIGGKHNDMLHALGDELVIVRGGAGEDKLYLETEGVEHAFADVVEEFALVKNDEGFYDLTALGYENVLAKNVEFLYY